jgi:hypothetical protein
MFARFLRHTRCYQTNKYLQCTGTFRKQSLGRLTRMPRTFFNHHCGHSNKMWLDERAVDARSTLSNQFQLYQLPTLNTTASSGRHSSILSDQYFASFPLPPFPSTTLAGFTFVLAQRLRNLRLKRYLIHTILSRIIKLQNQST